MGKTGAFWHDDGGGFLVEHRTEGCPPDDGIASGTSKFWLTIEEGKSSWLEVMIPCLVYINGAPRIFAWPGDRVAVSVYLGRQSIKVTRARKRG